MNESYIEQTTMGLNMLLATCKIIKTLIKTDHCQLKRILSSKNSEEFDKNIEETARSILLKGHFMNFYENWEENTAQKERKSIITKIITILTHLKEDKLKNIYKIIKLLADLNPPNHLSPVSSPEHALSNHTDSSKSLLFLNKKRNPKEILNETPPQNPHHVGNINIAHKDSCIMSQRKQESQVFFPFPVVEKKEINENESHQMKSIHIETFSSINIISPAKETNSFPYLNEGNQLQFLSSTVTDTYSHAKKIVNYSDIPEPIGSRILFKNCNDKEKR